MTQRYRQLLNMAALSNEDDCTLWPYGLNNGYASVRAHGKVQYGHKLVRILYHGDGPGMVTLHSCNNKACVNPHHLRAGTQAENMQQAVADGLLPHLGQYKAEVVQIARALLWQGYTAKQVIAETGLASSCVYRHKAEMLAAGEIKY